MEKISAWRDLIRDVVIPSSGIVLVFFLAITRSTDYQGWILAGTMMGFPLAALADRKRASEKKQDEESE